MNVNIIPRVRHCIVAVDVRYLWSRWQSAECTAVQSMIMTKQVVKRGWGWEDWCWWCPLQTCPLRQGRQLTSRLWTWLSLRAPSYHHAWVLGTEMIRSWCPVWSPCPENVVSTTLLYLDWNVFKQDWRDGDRAQSTTGTYTEIPLSSTELTISIPHKWCKVWSSLKFIEIINKLIHQPTTFQKAPYFDCIFWLIVTKNNFRLFDFFLLIV